MSGAIERLFDEHEQDMRRWADVLEVESYDTSKIDDARSELASLCADNARLREALARTGNEVETVRASLNDVSIDGSNLRRAKEAIEKAHKLWPTALTASAIIPYSNAGEFMSLSELEDKLDLARTSIPPDAMNCTREEWMQHVINALAGWLARKLETARGS